MDRLIAPNSVPFAQADRAPAAGTPQYATDGDPLAGIAPTIWPAYAFNALQDEVRNVETAAGLTPDPNNWGQLLQALHVLFPTVTNGLAAFPANGQFQIGPLIFQVFTGPQISASTANTVVSARFAFPAPFPNGCALALAIDGGSGGITWSGVALVDHAGGTIYGWGLAPFSNAQPHILAIGW